MQSSQLIKTKGFTLIEVLVAMVILAVGLLGLASLQAIALKDNQDAYLRSQANLLAYEMSDRIRANAAYWRGLNSVDMQQSIDNAKTSDTPAMNCSMVTETEDGEDTDELDACDNVALGEYDVYRWWQDVNTMLPNAAIEILWDDDARTTTGGNEVIDLKLSWDRSNQAVDINRNDEGVSRATLELDVRL